MNCPCWRPRKQAIQQRFGVESNWFDLLAFAWDSIALVGAEDANNGQKIV